MPSIAKKTQNKRNLSHGSPCLHMPLSCVCVCLPPLPRSSVRICMVLNFLLKNHLSSAVEAVCIYEALKDLMHYVAQMVTLEKNPN